MSPTEAMRQGLFYNDQAAYLRLKDQVMTAERELNILKDRMNKAELLYMAGRFYQRLVEDKA